LLIPVVKAWCTEQCVEIASTGVQIHGGMGFVEETGAAQYLRDARITTIYEGTTGIQANDLVGRKVGYEKGATALAVIAEMRKTVAALSSGELADIGKSLASGIDALEEATRWIVDNFHWSWIFFINLPVGALGLFMVWRFVQEPEDVRAANAAAAVAQRRNMDWLGIALLAVGLATLQFFLEEGQQKDWFESHLIVGVAVVSVVALALFVWRELTAPVPAVNLRLFKDPVFTAGSAIGALMFAILLASMFLLPVFMQELLGFTAMQSGLALMPRTLVMMAVTPFVGRLYGKLSPRVLMGFGVLLISYGSWVVSHITLQTTSAGITQAIIVQGIGFSFLFVPLTATALSNVPRHQLADATGLNSLLRQVGASTGLAVFATLLTREGIHAKAALAAHVTADRPEVQERLARLAAGFAARGFDPVSAREAALRALDGIVRREAMVISFERVLLLTGILFLAVLPLLYFLKVNRRGPAAKVHVEIEV